MRARERTTEVDSARIRVLLVADAPGGSHPVIGLLADPTWCSFHLDRVDGYGPALGAVVQNLHDVHLVDSQLGSRRGLDFMAEARTVGSKAPSVLLAGDRDRPVLVEAMNAGAADVVFGDEMNPWVLERAIRYSVEHGRVVEQATSLQHQLRQSQKMEAFGQLAGGIAHDFNNLLTAVLGYTHLGASMAPDGTRLESQFQEINKAVLRATGLTKQLLAFTRPQMTELEVVGLNDLVLNAHLMLRRLIGENIELVTVTDPELGEVRADSGQIEQVVFNLAINARDAMPHGGKLTIETHNSSSPGESESPCGDLSAGDYVTFAVTDNGTGMSEDLMARIFEPFFTTKEDGKGTGLGLSTCCGIVKQHGGHIEVRSQLDRGSTFSVCLPRVDAAISAVRQVSHSQGLHLGTEMVLVVDDEGTVRDMSARVLREQGYTVVEAENGDEALKVADEFAEMEVPLDLLFTDLVMPIMGAESWRTV